MNFQRAILIISLLLSLGVNSQDKKVILDWTQYFKMINKCDSLYSRGNYREAANGYSEAFKFNNQGFSLGNKYDAARAWTKSGQTDSAISNLKQEVEFGFSEVTKLRKEKAFLSIHKYKQWKEIVSDVVKNQKRETELLGKYKNVKSHLDKVFILDQKYRSYYQRTIDSFGIESKQMKELTKKMQKADRKNLKYVSEIIDKYGWISSDTIGIEGANTLFMVIQHADSLTQEKYLL